MLARDSRWLSGLLFLLALASVGLTTLVLMPGGVAGVISLVVDGAGFLQRLQQGQSTLWLWLAVFAAISFLLQLLIVPSGSLLLIGAGFVLGVWPSVLIYTAMQCMAILPVFRLCEYSIRKDPLGVSDRLDQWLAKSGASRVVDAEPLISGMVLRLTPVLPSAAATGVAAFTGIPISVFLSSTLLVGWVRPLFFASVGGAVSEFSSFATALSGDFRAAPLMLVFVAMVMLLAIKLWLRFRSGS